MDSTDNRTKDLKDSLKATSLFGGVQIVGILVSIVKTKCVALLIGPIGVGIVELYNSTIQLITTSTNFSLGVSAVRDIAVAYKSGDKEHLSYVASLFSKVVWFTGLLGLSVCLLGSPLWSKLSFDNYNYTVGFIFLSCILLFNQLNAGKTVLLQGTNHYKYLALSGLWGSIIGLVTTVPIYYFLGLDGVVLVLILSSVVSLSLTHYYSSKLGIKLENLPFNKILKDGQNLIKQGIPLSVNFIFSALEFYVLRVFIGNYGSISELGLFSSGFLIVNTYVGLIFQSMSKEYYPRLSSLSSNKSEFSTAINNQIYLMLLLLGPLIIVFLVLSEQLLMLLYSDKFVGASMMMSYAMLGVVLQVPTVCMGFAFLAKGDNKPFLFWETIGKIQFLLTNIVFYYFWGLLGLGISYVVSYLYGTIQYSCVCGHRYGFYITKRLMTIMITYLIGGFLVIFISSHYSFVVTILLGGFLMLLSALYSFMKLNEIINIKSYLRTHLSFF